jgi:hypothetical protein
MIKASDVEAMTPKIEAMKRENAARLDLARKNGFSIEREPSENEDNIWAHRVAYRGQVLADYSLDLDEYEVVMLLDWLRDKPIADWPKVASDFAAWVIEERESLEDMFQ